MKHFRRLTFLLSFILILTAGGVVAMAANNGPCEDEEESYAYVQFYNLEKDDMIYVYSFKIILEYSQRNCGILQGSA